MVILHVAAPAWVGGLESVLYALAAGHRRADHQVCVISVVAPAEAEHPLHEALRRADVDVVPVVAGTGRYTRERAAVGAECTARGVEIVHTHGYRPDVVDAPVARKLGIPTVTTVHGFTGGGIKNHFYEWLQRRSCKGFDAVVTVSRPLADRLARDGVPRQRLHVVPNCLASRVPVGRSQARRSLGLPEDGFIVGWVGRLSREKGPDVLLLAFARLAELPIDLSIIGSGRLDRDLRAAARSAGVADRVTWHGAVPGADRLLTAFDCLVLSSRSEGVPMVLLEAMGAGVPVVATRVGGILDVVSEGEAMLVPPEDNHMLAEAIRTVFSEPERAHRKAAAARARVESEFALEPWLARYEQVYRQAVATRGGPA